MFLFEIQVFISNKIAKRGSLHFAPTFILEKRMRKTFFFLFFFFFSFHAQIKALCIIIGFLFLVVRGSLAINHDHGCQNLDLDLTILWFYNPTCQKQSGSFKDLCDCSRSVRSYNSDNPKRSWFLVIFFNLTEGLVGPKWKIVHTHRSIMFWDFWSL